MKGFSRTEEPGLYEPDDYRLRDLIRLHEFTPGKAAVLEIALVLLEHPWKSNLAREVAERFLGEHKVAHPPIPRVQPTDWGILPCPGAGWLSEPAFTSPGFWTRRSPGWQGVVVGDRPCPHCRGPWLGDRCRECGQQASGFWDRLKRPHG